MTIDMQNHDPEAATKVCVRCLAPKPLSDFLRRSGGGVAGRKRRRGTCRACRQQVAEERVADNAAEFVSAPVTKLGNKPKQPEPNPAPKPENASKLNPVSKPKKTSKLNPAPKLEQAPKPSPAKKLQDAAKSARHGKPAHTKSAHTKPHAQALDPTDPAGLRPTRLGFIRMRGKTDNGRRWYQEVDPELAVTLVRERAAIVINQHTIRRIYSNKEFRELILTRDNYTCHYCGLYGDTLDHLLPRAKGGHTTPDNCVCACNECNQSKADRDFDEFVGARE